MEHIIIGYFSLFILIIISCFFLFQGVIMIKQKISKSGGLIFILLSLGIITLTIFYFDIIF